MAFKSRFTNDKPRSDAYQYLFCETPYAHEDLEWLSLEESLYGAGTSELIAELKDQLRAEFWRLAKEKLTPLQHKIITLRADGWTMVQIANLLNINQSNIHRSLSGVCFYKDGSKSKSYGGSFLKLKKCIENDPAIQDILAKINELS